MGRNKLELLKYYIRPYACKVVRLTLNLAHWRQRAPASPTSSCISSQGCIDQHSRHSHMTKKYWDPPGSSLCLPPHCYTGAPKSQASKRSKANRNSPSPWQRVKCISFACPYFLRRALPPPLPTSPTLRNSFLLSQTHVPSQEKEATNCAIHSHTKKKKSNLVFRHSPFLPCGKQLKPKRTWDTISTCNDHVSFFHCDQSKGTPLALLRPGPHWDNRSHLSNTHFICPEL